MTIFLYIMGSILTAQYLYEAEKGKVRTGPLWLTYIFCVLLWPFTVFIVTSLALWFLVRGKHGS